MISAPGPQFEPQVGWTYEPLPGGKPGFLKLRLVELPDRSEFSTIFEITIPVMWLGRHFEELPIDDGREFECAGGQEVYRG